MRIRDLFRISALPVFIASLCCVSPVIIFLFGLGTASVASSLADTLYGEYKWYFRGVGLIALMGALALHLRRTKHICTLDEAVRRRNEIINSIVLTLAAGIVGYLFFLYVVVHYVGVWLSIWN
jgi:hypothetical protein